MIPDSMFIRTGVPSRDENFPKYLKNEPSAEALAWTRSEAIIQALAWPRITKMNSTAVTVSMGCRPGRTP